MFNNLRFDSHDGEYVTDSEFDEVSEFLHGIAVIHELELQFEYFEEAECADTKIAIGRTKLLDDLKVVTLDVRRQIRDFRLCFTTETALVVKYILP